MTSLDDPGFAGALNDASARFEALHAELLDAHPTFRGNLAIPGMLVGYGLGSFVANGMSDDDIVTHVLVIVSQIRRAIETTVTQDDGAAVH